MENPIKMDDLGVPLFSETSIWGPVKNATADGTDGVDSLMEGDEGTKRKAHVLSEWAWYFSPGNLRCKRQFGWMFFFERSSMWTYNFSSVFFKITIGTRSDVQAKPKWHTDKIMDIHLLIIFANCLAFQAGAFRRPISLALKRLVSSHGGGLFRMPYTESCHNSIVQDYHIPSYFIYLHLYSFIFIVHELLKWLCVRNSKQIQNFFLSRWEVSNAHKIAVALGFPTAKGEVKPSKTFLGDLVVENRFPNEIPGCFESLNRKSFFFVLSL